MGIIIEHIKPTVLLLLAFLTLSICSRDRDVYFTFKLPAFAITDTIKAKAEEVAKMCNHDLKCEKKYMTVYSQQRKNYLVRRLTALASDAPFCEQWCYKTENGEKLIDLARTCKAYQLWEDPDICKKTKKCLAEYNKIAQFLLRNSMEMLTKKQREREIEHCKREVEGEIKESKKEQVRLIGEQYTNDTERKLIEAYRELRERDLKESERELERLIAEKNKKLHS